jgi:hypothetical protein
MRWMMGSAGVGLGLALACGDPDPGPATTAATSSAPTPTPTTPAPAPAQEGLVGPIPAMGLPDGPQFQVVAVGGPCDRDDAFRDIKREGGKLTISVCTNTTSEWYDELRDPSQGDAKDAAVRYVGLATRGTKGGWQEVAPGWVLAADVGKWVTMTAPIESDVTAGHVAIWAEAEADAAGPFGMYLYKPMSREDFSAVPDGVTLLDAGGGAAGLDRVAAALGVGGVTRGGAAAGGPTDFIEVFYADMDAYDEALRAQSLLDKADIGRKIVLTPWPESPTQLAVAVGEL